MLTTGQPERGGGFHGDRRAAGKTGSASWTCVWRGQVAVSHEQCRSGETPPAPLTGGRALERLAAGGCGQVGCPPVPPARGLGRLSVPLPSGRRGPGPLPVPVAGGGGFGPGASPSALSHWAWSDGRGLPAASPALRPGCPRGPGSPSALTDSARVRTLINQRQARHGNKSGILPRPRASTSHCPAPAMAGSSPAHIKEMRQK